MEGNFLQKGSLEWIYEKRFGPGLSPMLLWRPIVTNNWLFRAWQDLYVSKYHLERD